jgi:hypothetical protein
MDIPMKLVLAGGHGKRQPRRKQCLHALLFINLFMSLSAYTRGQQNNHKPKLCFVAPRMNTARQNQSRGLEPEERLFGRCRRCNASNSGKRWAK